MTTKETIYKLEGKRTDLDKWQPMREYTDQEEALKMLELLRANATHTIYGVTITFEYRLLHE